MVEASVLPYVKRISVLSIGGIPPYGLQRDMEGVFAHALHRSAKFGYREAQAEIERLRAGTPVLAMEIPDAGSRSRVARQGLQGVEDLADQRAHEATWAVVEVARKDGLAFGAKALHRWVLELVGEVLNAGRTAGALSLPNPPEFALRSEQLDKTTCDACTRLHGEIVQIDTNDYYALLPPEGCYGGGRCRGIMVYGDSQAQMTP